MSLKIPIGVHNLYDKGNPAVGHFYDIMMNKIQEKNSHMSGKPIK
jgi:hypothetical protein